MFAVIKETDFCCDHAKEALKNIPKDNVCSDLSDFFKIFGDYTRVKILFAMKEHEICVNDLSKILGMQQPAVSYQLKILKNNKLVASRQDGKMTMYRLNDHHVFELLETALIHLTHN